MNAKEIILHINPASYTALNDTAEVRGISIETLILEVLDQYLQSKEWAAFDKDVQTLMRENADLMRRLADS